jgi:hypothetical protein
MREPAARRVTAAYLPCRGRRGSGDVGRDDDATGSGDAICLRLWGRAVVVEGAQRPAARAGEPASAQHERRRGVGGCAVGKFQVEGERHRSLVRLELDGRCDPIAFGYRLFPIPLSNRGQRARGWSPPSSRTRRWAVRARTSDPQLVDSVQRPHQFARVRSTRIVARNTRVDRTVERTRANETPCHSCHASGSRTGWSARLLVYAAGATAESASLRYGRSSGAGSDGTHPRSLTV